VAYENCYLEDLESEKEDFNEITTMEEEDQPQEISEDEDFHSSPV
jgi:hypothetical protein